MISNSHREYTPLLLPTAIGTPPAAIREINELAAECVTALGEPVGAVGGELFEQLPRLQAEIKALFPEKAFKAYRGFENMIAPGNLQTVRKRWSVDQTIRARDEALRALYAEVFPLKKARHMREVEDTELSRNGSPGG